MTIALALALGSQPILAPRNALAADARSDGPVSLAELDTPSGPADMDAEQTLYLEVYFDDRPSDLIATFQRRGGRLSTTPDELRALGIVMPATVTPDAAGQVSLDALPGLHYRYLADEQRVVLRVPTVLRPLQHLGYRPPVAVSAQRDSGLLLDYDSYARRFDGDSSLAVATTLRWFGRAGALQSTGIGRAGADSPGFERLETFWRYSDPNRLWNWTAGDLISGGLAWTRPVRMAGLQWQRNFSVRPDLITIPLPSFSGSAAVPSSIELLVNDVRQFSSDINDGPFVLDSFPRVTGAGQATVLVRDALGRSTQTTVPIYVDSQRLAPGLTDFSLEAGLLRRGYGDGHNDYDDPAISGSWRRGLSDGFTLEVHGEADEDLRLAGLGMVWSPWRRWGVLTASLTHSDAAGQRGSQHTVGYQWSDARCGVDLQVQRASAGFRDLGRLTIAPAAEGGWLREHERLSAWTALPRGSLAFTWLRFEEQGSGRDSIRSLSWSQALGARVALSASVFDSRRSGQGAALSMSLPLGANRDASVSVNRNDGHTHTTAALRQTPDYDGGWGWQLQASDRLGGQGQASTNVRGRYGEAWVGVDHALGQTGMFFQSSGSVVWMRDQLFASRHIGDSFAVVSTQGIADMPILSENRRYGRTNARGYLLLPELRGWQRNRIAIDPDALDANYRLGDIELNATPADRSGILVQFDLAKVRPAVAVLLGPDGVPVPAGSRATLLGSAAPVLVGFDGEAYLEDVTATSQLELDVAGVRCRYRVSAAAVASETGVPRIGPLRCETSTP